jgi:hypothetical protein
MDIDASERGVIELGSDYRLVRAGAVCGIAATFAYLAKTLLPLPHLLNMLCWLSFGPLVVAGVPGLAEYLQRGRRQPVTETGKVFGVLAGAFHLAMTVVQSTNLTIIGRTIRSAESDQLRANAQSILDGVFTVQLGLGFCWDLFIALTTILFAIALLRDNVTGKLLGVGGLAIGGSFLAFKLYTFPIPPAEAGLFDLGPGVGVWFLALCFFVFIRNRALTPTRLTPGSFAT